MSNMQSFLESIGNENSVNANISMIKKMKVFFGVEADEELIEEVKKCSHNNIVTFISEQSLGKSNTTISNNISRVKKIFKYFGNEKALENLNLFTIKGRVQSKNTEYYTPGQINEIIEKFINYQDKALVLLIYLGLYDNNFETLSNLKSENFNIEARKLSYMQGGVHKTLKLTEYDAKIIYGAIKETEMEKYSKYDGRQSKPYKIQINDYIFRSKERVGALDKVSTATFKKRFVILKEYLMDDNISPVTIKNSKIIYDLVRYEYDYNQGKDINQLELKEYLKERGQIGTIELLNMSKKELKPIITKDIISGIDKKIIAE